jgi:hypothetical protein
MKPEIFQTIKKSCFNCIKILTIVSITFFLSSCTTITDSLYVQDVNVKGPINQPPIRISGKDSTTFTISPKFFINSSRVYNARIDGHTQVNSKGIFQVDTVINGNEKTYKIAEGKNTFDFEGENLHWSIPDYMVGLDLDIALSKKVALSGGFNLSGKDRTSLYGYRVGLGFFSASKDIGVRFDGGLMWQKYTYDAASVIVRETGPDFGSSTSEVIFYRDKGKSVNLNHYLSLTINTLYEDLPVNFLINVGYSGQSLVDYEPSNPDEQYYILNPFYRVEDMRGEAYVAFINISPGIYMKLNEWSRLVFATRFFFQVDLESSSNSTFVIPMLQFDLSL